MQLTIAKMHAPSERASICDRDLEIMASLYPDAVFLFEELQHRRDDLEEVSGLERQISDLEEEVDDRRYNQNTLEERLDGARRALLSAANIAVNAGLSQDALTDINDLVKEQYNEIN